VSTPRRPISRRLLLFGLRAVAASVLVTLALVLPLRWLHPATSSFMLQNWAQQRSLSAEVHYHWVPRDKISRRAALAVLAAEDQKFFSHSGFDIASIRKVWKRNGRGGQLRGASTISQQVAKNLWLWPARSWLRKGLEVWFTVWLELLWPKERILEIYLNIAQFGPHVFGVEAASRLYFRKPAAELNAPEAALLAAVLPNPHVYRVRNPSRYTTRRQAWIQRQAGQLGGELPAARWSGRQLP